MENSSYSNGSKPVKYWYLPLILGLIFIAVGIWVIFTRVESYLALSILFAIAFLISGVLGISYAISNRKILMGWGGRWRPVSQNCSLVSCCLAD